MSKRPFKGVAKLDVRDSTPDWAPYTPPKAPDGAPDIEINEACCSGVIFAHGSRFGGDALFIKDGKLHYVYNFLGIKRERKFISKTTVKPGKYTVGMEFVCEGQGKYGKSTGRTKPYINEKVEAGGDMKTQFGEFTLSGDRLCKGLDSGDAVSEDYTTPVSSRWRDQGDRCHR